MKARNVLFVTGTRADFGKLRPLMEVVEHEPGFMCQIYATGMHTQRRYGLTVEEIRKAGFASIHTFYNQLPNEPMDLVLSTTVAGLSRFVGEQEPDLIVVHGDRLEALAGAIVGAFRNILVAHVEGGELSGTVDELIRHAVTKLSHTHFVANDAAASVLIQLGETETSVYPIGSPDIDVMLSGSLPGLPEVRERYGIPWDDFAIVAFHPVTTEAAETAFQASELVRALIASDLNYLVVGPNNDPGNVEIFAAYDALEGNPRFVVRPSLRFEHFLTALKHARFIVGNSSSGIREAPVYGVPSVNVGSRQNGRFEHEGIINVEPRAKSIIEGLRGALTMPRSSTSTHFGDGTSAERFAQVIRDEEFWATPRQKEFRHFVSSLS